MAMRREVEEIVTRFGVVGLDQVRAAFGATAGALEAAGRQARQAEGDLSAAGQASSRAADAVVAANRRMRESVSQAEGSARDSLGQTILRAQERERAAREAVAKAKAEAEKAARDLKTAPSAASARTAAGQGVPGAAQSQAVQAARAATAAARARFEEERRLAAQSEKAEREEASAREAAREAGLRDELAAIDRRAAARKAATDGARRRAIEARENEPVLRAQAAAFKRQAEELRAKSSVNALFKEFRAQNPGMSDFDVDEMAEKEATARTKRFNELIAQAREYEKRATGVRAMERRADRSFDIDERGAARDEAARAAARARFEAGPVTERETALLAERARIDARAEARRDALEKARRHAAENTRVIELNRVGEAEARKQVRRANRESTALLARRATRSHEGQGPDAVDAEFDRLEKDRYKRLRDGQTRLERSAGNLANQTAAAPGLQRRLARAEAVEAGRAPQEAARRAEIEAEIQAVRAAEADKLNAGKTAREAKLAAAQAALQDAERILAQETTAAEAAAAAQVRAAQKAAAAEAKAHKDRLKAAAEAAAAAVSAAETQLAATLQASAAAVQAEKAAAAERVRIARETAAAAVTEAKRVAAAAKEAEKAAKEADKAAREAERAERDAQRNAAGAQGGGAAGARRGPEPRRRGVPTGPAGNRPLDAASAQAAIRDAVAARRAEQAAIDAMLAGQAESRRKLAAAKAAGQSDAELAVLAHFEAEKIALLEETARKAGATAQAKRAAAVRAEAFIRRAAEASARAEEQAAKRAAKAWKDAADTIGRVRRNLPRLGLMNPAGSLWSSLTTRGFLPTAWGLGARVVSTAFGVTSAAGRALTGTLGLVGSVGAGLLSIGGHAVTAAGHLAYELGSGAVSLLERLGSAAVGAAAKVASIGKDLALKGVLAGTAAGIAGVRFAQRATGDTAERAGTVFEKSIDQRINMQGYQALAGAAKTSGVAMKDFETGLQAAQTTLRNLNADPELASWLTQIGVRTTDVYGRLYDTSTILNQIMPRLRGLGMQDQVNILTRVFGSYENWEKLYPLVRSMMNPNDGVVAAGWQRQARFGTIIGPEDILRMRAYRAATADLSDAWAGLKQTISRAVGNEVIRGLETLAWTIADNRQKVAAFMKDAYSVGQVLYYVATEGLNAAGRISAAFYQKHLWFRVLVEGTYQARTFALAMRDLGAEAVRAYEGIRAQQASPNKQVWIEARQGVVDLVSVLFYAEAAAKATMPFWRDLWATVSGRDADVTRFTWLLTLRDGLLTAGRAAREAWFAITGQDDRVQEFPVILRIRQAISDAIGWVREFGREAWAALSGGDAPADVRFPWMFAARQAVVDFVDYVRARWRELGEVWNGGQGETGLGRWFAWVLDKFEKGKAVFWSFVGEVKKVWSDLQKVWEGKTGPNDQYNFAWIKTVAGQVRDLAKDFSAAWEIFKSIFQTLDSVVKHVTLGNLNLETLILVATMGTLLGVARTFGWMLQGVALGMGLLRGSIGGVAAAVGGAGAAGAAAGAVGAAGAGAVAAGGLAGALSNFGVLAGRAGDAAGGAAGKWDRFRDAVKGAAGALTGMRLLGLGAAGMALSHFAPEGALGDGMSIAGGALTYGAAGAGIGSMFGPGGTLIGGAAGAAYGAYAGYRSRYPGEPDPSSASQAAPAFKPRDTSVMTEVGWDQIAREAEIKATMATPEGQARYAHSRYLDQLRRQGGYAPSSQQANPDAMSRWAREVEEAGYRDAAKAFTAAPIVREPSGSAPAANPLNVNIGPLSFKATQDDQQRGGLLSQLAALDGNPAFG